MQSMTGYSYLEASTRQFSYSIEIKSLNSKFLEIYANLPKPLRKEENNFIQILKDRFIRGKIVLTIEIFDWVEERSVSINRKLLKKYYTELKKVERELKKENFFSGDILFSFDNVIQTGKSSISSQSYKSIMVSLNDAIDKALRSRIKEGNEIKKDILYSLNVIHKNTNEIKAGYKNISRAIFDKLKKNIESIVEKPVNDIRLYTEVAILVDKLDINEEIVRLNTHIGKFKAVMEEKDQIGKSIDFLAQEMFREVNTIASKANSSEVSHMVIDMKNHIDKIREHSRNIM